MEMNLKIESPEIELTTPSHVSTAAVSIMFREALTLPTLGPLPHLKSRPFDLAVFTSLIAPLMRGFLFGLCS